MLRWLAVTIVLCLVAGPVAAQLAPGQFAARQFGDRQWGERQFGAWGAGSPPPETPPSGDSANVSVASTPRGAMTPTHVLFMSPLTVLAWGYAVAMSLLVVLAGATAIIREARRKWPT